MADSSPASKVEKLSTYCHQCVNGPDLLKVEVIDGVATKIEPNFDLAGEHPADGKVCVKPYGLVEKLYHPDRILTPLKRTNPKKGRDEDPGWQEITWDEALDTLAEKLNAARAKGLLDDDGLPRVAWTNGGAHIPFLYMGAFTAFLVAWGPMDRSLGAGGTVKCYHTEHTYGEMWHRAFTTLPDTNNCNYLIAFGNNANASGGVTSVRRHADARARGMKRIQFEPVLSTTGAKADLWVPIKPRTDSAVIYAMTHVLMHEHKLEELDVPFLRDHTASPYLIGPHGYYLRDAATRKPLVWDEASASAVAFDQAGCVPALRGPFTVEHAIEVGADDECWDIEQFETITAFDTLHRHVADNTPEWAAGIADVPAETIRNIANEFLEAAEIGAGMEIEGRELPYRPVAVMLGKSVNNGWGAYECVWGRTIMCMLVGALEVPGAMLGSLSVIVGPEWDRMAACQPGEDGFMLFPAHPTSKEDWAAQPETRHAHSTLLPFTGTGHYQQNLGSTTFGWMRMQGRAGDNWKQPAVPDVWLLYRGNPVISFNEADRIMDTIAEFPFTAAFAYTHDETNHFADLLLPEAMDLESTQLLRIGGTSDFEQQWQSEGWCLRQAVVQPCGESREFTWIATELARRTGLLEDYHAMINAGVLGIPLKGESWDFSLDVSREHSVTEIWDAICRAASADLTNGEDICGLDWFREHGFKMRPFSSLRWYLYPRLVDQGLRFELPYQERVLRTGEELGRRLHEQDIHWWDRQLGEYESMPHWQDLCELWESTLARSYDVNIKDYPFWLITGRSMQYAWGGNVSIQIMREVSDNVFGHDGVIMNTTSAAALGLSDGDAVVVESPIGSQRCIVRCRQGVRPDVAVMLAQWGHWLTPVAKELKRPSLNNLVPMNMDLIDGGGSTADVVKVRISAA